MIWTEINFQILQALNLRQTEAKCWTKNLFIMHKNLNFIQSKTKSLAAYLNNFRGENLVAKKKRDFWNISKVDEA